MAAHSAQGKSFAVGIEWIVFQVNWNLIKCLTTDLITQHCHFNHIAWCIYLGQGNCGCGVGCGIGIVGWFFKCAVYINLHSRNSGIGIDTNIQQQGTTVIGKLKLLPLNTGSYTRLPTNFSGKVYTICILSYKSLADVFYNSFAFGYISKGISIKIVVKHNVAHIGQTEIAQGEAQHQVRSKIAGGITEQFGTSKVAAEILGLIAKADASWIIYIKQGWLIDLSFVLRWQPVYSIKPKTFALQGVAAKAHCGLIYQYIGIRSRDQIYHWLGNQGRHCIWNNKCNFIYLVTHLRICIGSKNNSGAFNKGVAICAISSRAVNIAKRIGLCKVNNVYWLFALCAKIKQTSSGSKL